MPTATKSINVALPLPAVGQRVELTRPWDAAYDGYQCYTVPVGTKGTVTEVSYDESQELQKLFIGIKIDKGQSEEIDDWLENYEALGEGDTLYVYDSTDWTHNGENLVGIFEFHYHFKYID